MSILDTFFILFDADASKLDKGLTDSEKTAQGLVGKLEVVDAAAGKMGGTFLQSLAGLAGAAMAAVSLGAMTQAMFAASDHADALNESVERLGLNIETVSAWGDAIKKNGGSVEGFIGSIEGLNSQLAQMEVTGKSRAAPFLKELGIDLDAAANKGKNAMDFLPQIADAFAGMDKQKSVALGKRLGFDQATIMTLQQGRQEVEALLEKERELGVVTKKQGEIADAFGDQMDDTRHAFRSVWLGVSEYVLPPLTWAMEKFQEVALFMRKHSDFIVGLMIALGAAVTLFALPPLIAMASAAVVAFAPFILAGVLVAALATAFALLYDDVMAFVDGGDSMLGQIVGRWPIVGQIIKGLVAEFAFLWDIAKAVGAFLVGMFNDPAAAAEQFKSDVSAAIDALIANFPGLQEAIGAVTGAFTSAGDTITGVWEAVTAAIQAAIAVVMGGINAVVGAFNAAKGFLGFGGGEAPTGGQGGAASAGDTRTAIARGKEQIGAAGASPLTSQTSNSISNTTAAKNTTVTVGKVEVKTAATDAEGISKAIGGSMQSQMRQAANNFDDGVLA